MGQVYDGNDHSLRYEIVYFFIFSTCFYFREPIILYKPVYVTVDRGEEGKKT